MYIFSVLGYSPPFKRGGESPGGGGENPVTPVNGCKQRSMLNVLKKIFIHLLSDLKQDHTAM
jgi:hypothetical protein